VKSFKARICRKFFAESALSKRLKRQLFFKDEAVLEAAVPLIEGQLMAEDLSQNLPEPLY
jgi:hypothetical protein